MRPAYQEVFITLVVDSATPAWDELFPKYLGALLARAVQGTNASKYPKKPRISYVQYSSATSYASPIVKDMYFTRNQDTVNTVKSLSGPLQGPIARNLPDGGSAALEGLIRGLEHFDLLEELEPHSCNSPRHLFLITSSPPDQSQRPLWNHYDKFDNFGWKQSEEWLQQRTIALTLVTNRLPSHPIFTSLFKSLNPGSGDPIPPTGPVRVFMSRTIWENVRTAPNQPPNQVTANPAIASHSSPAIATSSPAANAASPNTTRKRKAESDIQETSPRRLKFPAGTVGNPPVTNTPPPGMFPPNGSPVRSASALATRPPSGASNPQIKMEVQPPPIPNHAANVVRNPNTPQPPQAGPQGGFPSQTTQGHTDPQSNPALSTTNNPPRPIPGPAEGASVQSNPQIEAFLSSSQEAQRERFMRLKNMIDDHEKAIAQLQAENRHQEAKDRITQRDKVREFFMVLMHARQVRLKNLQQNPALAGMAPGAGGLFPGQTPANPVVAQQRLPFGTGVNDPTAAAAGMNLPVQGATSFPSQPDASVLPQNGAPQPAQFLWRGSLSITGKDGRRASPELLVYLTTIKATAQQQDALTTWPTKIFMTPIRQNTPPDKLVTWLNSNKPEGLFSVRAIGLEHWPASQRTPSNTVAIQGTIQKFAMAQNAIINNKLVLHGTVELPTGGTVTLILIHTPNVNNTLGPSEPQIAIARYMSPPNLSMLPGVPLPQLVNPGGAPISGSWNPGLGIPTNQPVNGNPTTSAPGAFNPGTFTADMNPVNNRASITAMGLPENTPVGAPQATASGGNNNQQQLANLLMSIGGANLLNSLGGPGNIDVNNVMKNPQVLNQINRLKQQHQLQQQQQQQHQQQQQQQHQQQQHQQQQQQQQQLAFGMAGGGGLGNAGMGNTGMGQTGVGTGGLSGANLLDRLNNQPLNRNSASGPVGGSGAFGPAATSAAARQQFLNTLAAHSSAVGAMNNNNAASALFNQFNQINQGLGGGVAGSINMAGGASGAHNLHLNINVGPSGSNAMGGMGGTNAPGLNINSEILRRASILSAQRGIPQQDALKILLNLGAQGWNNPSGGG